MSIDQQPCADHSDAALIERSLAEPEAFTGLFHRHGRQLRRYVGRRLGADVADDVVADAFLIAFQRRRAYDLSRTDAGPWLYGIASNVIRGQLRTELRAYRALARTGVDPVPESFAEQVDNRLVADTVGPKLAAALARMGRRDRDVVLLVAWADLKPTQVAEALDIPVGTVRSRLHRARKRLRAALGDVDPRNAEELHHG